MWRRYDTYISGQFSLAPDWTCISCEISKRSEWHALVEHACWQRRGVSHSRCDIRRYNKTNNTACTTHIPYKMPILQIENTSATTGDIIGPSSDVILPVVQVLIQGHFNFDMAAVLDLLTVSHRYLGLTWTQAMHEQIAWNRPQAVVEWIHH